VLSLALLMATYLALFLLASNLIVPGERRHAERPCRPGLRHARVPDLAGCCALYGSMPLR
jgi:hypothetical protein